MTNRTTITLYARQKTLFLRLYDSLAGRCEQCGAEVFASSHESAASVLRITLPEVSGLIESGVLHAMNAPGGGSLICCNSLVIASSHYGKGVQNKTP